MCNPTITQDDVNEQLDRADEDYGYIAYWRGAALADMVTDAERRGWWEAHGEDCYYREAYASGLPASDVLADLPF